MSPPLRLQKYLAQCGIASRRKAEELIRAGRISIDGQTITAMGTQIDPEKQQVYCDQQPVQPRLDLIYILLNKPPGYVTTLSDPQGRPIVTSLLGNFPTRLFPVGRLDLDTDGALILTNDGDFAQRVLHPSQHTNKTYEAMVVGHLSPENLRRLQSGIELDDGLTAPCSARILKTFPRQSLVEITIHEGRKRQVKKMFVAIGHPVRHLRRTAYGKLRLGALGPGQFRLLNKSDLKKIFL